MRVAADGWLTEVQRCPSPNCDPRPDPEDVSLLVIHGISLPPGEFGGPAIEQLFTNCLDPQGHPYFRDIAGLRVSSHLLIRRDGALLQFVPFGERAWHAGESRFQGRAACNDFSIGIELEGTDDTPYSDPQYRALAAVIPLLQARYPGIERTHIVGHSEIAPGRKTDPGPAFDWGRLHRLLDA
ncbi:1,6-anhydro-N-acetylmuramyl-L-alanine amidase AmpD [Thiohalobacter sp. IOR34]|uniref:1,6-anhydro-N-acetylmuramyl-L-alanine amidase AmpD n=1 Tax=Thiohalobacter sp. IOR34 TaxID=3057176 RepID=UPI0025B1DDA8|nr:1,6-anhydro-N-acetylmuramyl-L-alanine amidase AmpD [Thiohalobacter sp. IOR34]WJW75165.1 1,6-anhydro-N-acetylmuramyl-L-alanine amidase AmpD [Thiohalobacter sp. IOR34]